MTTAPRPASPPLSLRTSARPRSCSSCVGWPPASPGRSTPSATACPVPARFLSRACPTPTCWTTSATTSAERVSGPL